MSARVNTRRFREAKRRFLAECKRLHRPCWLCGLPIDYDAAPNSTDDSFNLDHLFPVSKRPDMQEDPAGFRPSHASCNNLRGNRDPEPPLGTLSRPWIDENAAS